MLQIRGHLTAAAFAAGLATAAGCSSNTHSGKPVTAAEEQPNEQDKLLMKGGVAGAMPTGLLAGIEDNGELLHDRPLFHHLSWQTFLSLNRPAEENVRGHAHRTRLLGEHGTEPVVWETWPSTDDLYERPHGDPRPKWATLTSQVPRFGRRSFNQATNSPDLSVGTLVALNKSFVRYETRLNEVEFLHIVGNTLDHKDVLDVRFPVDGTGKLDLPVQSVHIKAAWKILTDQEQRNGRFYTIRTDCAMFWTDTNQPKIEEKALGLIGLHIVHKFKGQENFVWSTFEHVDNLLSEMPGREHGASPSLHSTNPPGEYEAVRNKPGPIILRELGSFPPCDPEPTEVVRRTPIDPETDRINRLYQQHANVKQTVWRYYKLVGTQWTAKGKSLMRAPKMAKGGWDLIEENQRPADIANVSLETFRQEFTCFQCHANAFGRYQEMVFFPFGRAIEKPKAVGPSK